MSGFYIEIGLYSTEMGRHKWGAARSPRRSVKPRRHHGGHVSAAGVADDGLGEETGELNALLDDVADFYQREVDYTLKNLSAMIEPVMIVFVGGAVLVLALGVFLPMWNMIAKVGGGG